MQIQRTARRSAILIALVLIPFAMHGQEPAKPAATTKALDIDPATKTVLMASDASFKGDLKEVWPGQAARFWVNGWTRASDSFTWTVRVPKAGDYSATLLIVNCGKILINCDLKSPAPVDIELAGESNKLIYTVGYRTAPMTNEWVRDELPGTLHLPAGESKITLRGQAKAGESFNLSLFSLELVKPGVARSMAKEAAKLRSSTAWMVNAKYGLMFTWTSTTQPRTGAQKSYEQAVNDFDVNAFADMVAGTGAGFIVFATSWSTYYFPGPIETHRAPDARPHHQARSHPRTGGCLECAGHQADDLLSRRTARR